jgi:SAM-dependent methyltransferase
MAVADPLDIAISSLGYRASPGLVENGAHDGDAARAYLWRDLKRKAAVDATYFRGSVPLVAFARADDDEVADVHRRLWNYSKVPLLIAGTPTQVRVFSCYMPPSPRDRPPAAEVGSVSLNDDVAAGLAHFGRSEVETGRVASEYPRYFERHQRVDRKLLANLRDLRTLLREGDVPSPTVDSLIGRSIFVRYLEDGAILTAEHFRELSPHSSYVDVLRAGVDTTYELFKALSARFNGDVFAPTPGEATDVSNQALETVASFLDGGDVATGQSSFWPYDFSVIPPELISSIYEQLLEQTQKADAAYYTPRSVVDLILDEVLPWEAGPVPRILDPACGSGIFLTQAYRRLVFRESVRTKERLGFAELAKLLEESIHGVDKSPAAISVAAFGLYLALLEEVDPPVAWETAKLPKLIGKNLVVQDFFDDQPETFSEFDLVIGNPPWQSALPEAARKYVKQTNVPIADQQLAQAFLWRAMESLCDEGVLGLLMPAKLLHNKSTKANAVRQHLYAAAGIETIFDLSTLRRELFETAVAPAAVVIARRRATEGEPWELIHAVPRPSPLQQTADGFVLGQEDIHRVSLRLATSHADVWKILLWGGERDLAIVARLRAHFRTLGEVAKDRGWVHGQGFQIKGGDRNRADELVGLSFVPTQSIAPFEADTTSKVVDERFMHRPRDPALYRGPHVLVRRGVARGRLAAVMIDIDATFNNAVVGVAGPAEDRDRLRLLAAYVNSSLGNYYHFLTSSTWGVERDVVEANELLSMPFPEFDSSGARHVLDVLDRLDVEGERDERWWQELNAGVFRAYDMAPDEVDQVIDTLQMRLDVFRRGLNAVAFRPPRQDQLDTYASVLRSELTDAAPRLKAVVRTVKTASPYTVAEVSFAFSGEADREPPEVDDLVAEARIAAEAWTSPVLILQPTALVMRGTRAYVLKQSEARFWTRSLAHVDAATILGQAALGS